MDSAQDPNPLPPLMVKPSNAQLITSLQGTEETKTTPLFIDLVQPYSEYFLDTFNGEVKCFPPQIGNKKKKSCKTGNEMLKLLRR